MNVLSLFSGIGAHDLGLQRAGMTIVGQVEIDEYCVDILRNHWPDVPKWYNIKTFNPASLGRLDIDLVTGGFPCQDISCAGKQAGLNGERSGLWWEMLRIIRDVRPRWVLIENVPALRTKGADDVIASLEEAGYTCWAHVVGASDIGATHRRKRVWIVANTSGNYLREQPGRGDGKDRQEASIIIDDCKTKLGYPDGERHERYELWEIPRATFRFPACPGEPQHDWEEPRTIELPLGGPINGNASRLAGVRRNALKALGNANLPQVVEIFGRAILKLDQLLNECRHRYVPLYDFMGVQKGRICQLCDDSYEIT